MPRTRVILWVPALALAACTANVPSLETREGAIGTLDQDLLLEWGGPEQANRVGFRPGGPEYRAQGPSAVAVGPGGAVYLLDRLNRRVLRVTGDQVDLAVAQVPEQAMDLAVGPDRAVAIYSPLQARIWLYDSEGQPGGELDVPRILRHVRGIRLGAQRQVGLESALGERYLLGSPGSPRSLAEVLHSKREGTVPVDASAAAAAVVGPGGQGELLLLRDAGRRVQVIARYPLPGAPLLGARVLGAAGQLVCLRLEKELTGRPGLALHVSRQAVCLDAVSGQLLRSVDLGTPGAYLPRRELALGGDPPRLAQILPEAQGLRLRVWAISRDGQRRAR